MREEEERVAAERAADFARPASPGANNLRRHDGFDVVNSNPVLRIVGASLGGVDDGDDVVDCVPRLIEGQANFYHTVLGSRYLRQHIEEHW